MLSSPNDGERANAATMATRMLKELGLDWRAFTQRAFKPEASPVQDEPESLLDLYLRILQWEELSDWGSRHESDHYARQGIPSRSPQSRAEISRSPSVSLWSFACRRGGIVRPSKASELDEYEPYLEERRIRSSSVSSDGEGRWHLPIGEEVVVLLSDSIGKNSRTMEVLLVEGSIPND
jgi:hypothetical protein